MAFKLGAGTGSTFLTCKLTSVLLSFKTPSNLAGSLNQFLATRYSLYQRCLTPHSLTTYNRTNDGS
jgi:hypothetical protein